VSTKGASAPFVAYALLASAPVRVAATSRPTRFEEFRYLGDKRSQVVYDLDTTDADAQALVAELLASEKFAAFSPDSLAEARNRGYHPHASARAAAD
jgi:hypothetical protein